MLLFKNKYINFVNEYCKANYILYFNIDRVK